MNDTMGRLRSRADDELIALHDRFVNEGTPDAAYYVAELAQGQCASDRAPRGGGRAGAAAHNLTVVIAVIDLIA